MHHSNEDFCPILIVKSALPLTVDTGSFQASSFETYQAAEKLPFPPAIGLP
jgi:hypothetical protein